MPAAATVYSDVTKIRLPLADGCLIVAVGSVPDGNPERWIAKNRRRAGTTKSSANRRKHNNPRFIIWEGAKWRSPATDGDAAAGLAQ